MDVYCTHCPGVEMDHKEHNGTHIYICPACPNITFEYTTEKDLENLKECLNQSK